MVGVIIYLQLRWEPYNIPSSFRRLGLNTKETKVVLSDLTSTAIQCSFVIWLNRDNKIWNEQATSTFAIPKKAPRKHTPFKNKVCRHSNAKYSQPLSKFYRPGFINKGNTCYMNALLQALSVLTGFWSTLLASGIRRAPYFTSCCCILPNNVFS